MAESLNNSGPTIPILDPSAVASFQEHLKNSTRIVAIIGAGLSASSGLPTFRGVDGLWRNYDVQLVASPAGWRRDPGLVWQLYSERRRTAMQARPNPGHYALVELAKEKPGFAMLSQNVDGLLQRAGMGEADAKGQLKLLHGNLFDLVCAGRCGHTEKNFEDPLCPALSAEHGKANAASAGIKAEKLPKASALLLESIAAKNKKILGDQYVEKSPSPADAAPLREPGKQVLRVPGPELVLSSGIQVSELPHCPKCKSNLLRPDVIWFGEMLRKDVVDQVEALFKEQIDLCLVIGTSGVVWPAAGYPEKARSKGARVAYVDMNSESARHSHYDDWVFLGDAAVILPQILGYHTSQTFE